MPVQHRVKGFSASEVLATIKHSAFPSLVTEGGDDVIVLRRLEDEFPGNRLTLIPAGGKKVVLEAFAVVVNCPRTVKPYSSLTKTYGC